MVLLSGCYWWGNTNCSDCSSGRWAYQRCWFKKTKHRCEYCSLTQTGWWHARTCRIKRFHIRAISRTWCESWARFLHNFAKDYRLFIKRSSNILSESGVNKAACACDIKCERSNIEKCYNSRRASDLVFIVWYCSNRNFQQIGYTKQ